MKPMRNVIERHRLLLSRAIRDGKNGASATPWDRVQYPRLRMIAVALWWPLETELLLEVGR